MRVIKDTNLINRYSDFLILNICYYKMKHGLKMDQKYLGLMFIFTVIYFTGMVGSTRFKREDQACAEKFRKLKHHSACAQRSSNVNLANTGVGDTDQQFIVDEHNKYRRLVSPTATNMLKMSWDAEVAMVAQHWAETCSFSHDDPNNRKIPGRFAVGQNIGKGYKSWTSVIKAWYDENTAFTYNSDTNQLGQVGHYTQVVWATSAKIGCGMADCGSTLFHVCNYAPGGNVGGVKLPYKSGTTCGDCTQTCNDKLCDCGDLVCENDGTMDLNSCACSCKYPSFQVDPRCQLDCSNVTEPFQCAQKSYVGDCTGAYNVPLECPNTCDVCPHGAYNYNSNESRSSGHLLQPLIITLCTVIAFCHSVY